MTLTSSIAPPGGGCDSEGTRSVQRFVFSAIPGQLGNQLASYANVMAVAIERGAEVANPAFWENAHSFESTRGDVLSRFPRRTSRLRPTRRLRNACYLLNRLLYRSAQMLCWVHSRGGSIQILKALAGQPFLLDEPDVIERMDRGRMVFFEGLKFRTLLVIEHAEAIRAHFRPIEEHRRRVAECAAQARAAHDVVVGVHIRLGDYVRFKGGRFAFSLDEYRRLMGGIRSLLEPQRVRFLITSNADLIRDDFSDFSVVFGPGHRVEDMYVLAECDYIFGPPSTFSGWASFYGDRPLWHVRRTGLEPDLGLFERSLVPPQIDFPASGEPVYIWPSKQDLPAADA